jgi:hypothetical protein
MLMLFAVGVASVPVLSQPASASPPSLQACTANNVKITAKQLGEIRGQRLEAFQFKNAGASTCGMYGYPVLKFFTASRLDARIKVVHDTSAYRSVTPKLLTIGPNDVVSFGMSFHGTALTSAAASKKCLVESILIQLPLAPVSSGDFAYHESFNACGANNVVAVTPVEGRSNPLRSH